MSRLAAFKLNKDFRKLIKLPIQAEGRAAKTGKG